MCLIKPTLVHSNSYLLRLMIITVSKKCAYSTFHVPLFTLQQLKYCNYVMCMQILFLCLAGLPGYLIDRLQSVLNAAAQLVNPVGKFEHVTPLLRDLHWLRVGQRVEFKLAVLVYRCLNDQGPPYLASDLHRVANLDTRRRLRSSSSDALTIPLTHLSTVGDCTFPVVAARVWNSLPSSVTSSPSLSTFKRNLKTELFARSYPA